MRTICPKCGSKKHSNKRSCCARDGAWFNKCGMPGDLAAEHTWTEGVQACQTSEMQAQSMLFNQTNYTVIENHINSDLHQDNGSPTVSTHYAVTSHSADRGRIFNIVDLTLIIIMHMDVRLFD